MNLLILNFQFDQEWNDLQAMEEKDKSFARKIAKAHSISDSEDSNCADDLNGSNDLFDSSGE